MLLMDSAHATSCTLNCNLLNGKCYCLNYSAFTNTKYVLPKIIFVHSLLKIVECFFPHESNNCVTWKWLFIVLIY